MVREVETRNVSRRGLIDVVYSSRCRSSGFIPGGDFAKQLKKVNLLNVIVYGARTEECVNQVTLIDAVGIVSPASCH